MKIKLQRSGQNDLSSLSASKTNLSATKPPRPKQTKQEVGDLATTELIDIEYSALAKINNAFQSPEVLISKRKLDFEQIPHQTQPEHPKEPFVNKFYLRKSQQKQKTKVSQSQENSLNIETMFQQMSQQQELEQQLIAQLQVPSKIEAEKKSLNTSTRKSIEIRRPPTPTGSNKGLKIIDRENRANIEKIKVTSKRSIESEGNTSKEPSQN